MSKGLRCKRVQGSAGIGNLAESTARIGQWQQDTSAATNRPISRHEYLRRSAYGSSHGVVPQVASLTGIHAHARIVHDVR